MANTKRKRAPGAGRPPIDRRGSIIAQVRFTREQWEEISRLASKHGRKNVSKEIRDAVRYWNRLLQKPDQATGALICLIAILVRRIEARTGKKWIEDPATAVFVRGGVESLIAHFAPAASAPVVVPPEIAGIPGELIVVAENLYPRPGVPEIQAELFGDEWTALARIVRDLGSGWQRNRAVWEKGTKS
jgi:hypothetical protein